jgi:hypothetical protein
MPKDRTTTPRVGRMISMRTAEAEAPARAAELRGAERNSGTAPLGAEVCAVTSEQTKSESHERRERKLMERVVERSNLRLAYQRVLENKGAAGVDQIAGDRAQRVACGALAEREEGATGRSLRAAAGATSRHTEAERRGTNARSADGGGSVDPAGPWERKFLGFSVTMHRESRLRIALESVRRLTGRVRELLRAGRGRSLAHTIETLNPLLRGWINYFQLTQSKGVLAELDGWVRRRLRCVLWRQWKRPATRARHLRALGLDAARAR